MAKDEIAAKIIIIVHLVNGKTITHEYDIPTSKKETDKLLDTIVNRTVALIRGKSNYLYFANPHIAYNPDNIAGIEISVIGTEELRRAFEKAQRRAGFSPISG